MKKLVLTMVVLSTSVMTSGCGIYSNYSAQQEYKDGLLADRARTQERKAEKKARDNFLAKNCQTTPDSRFINNQNGTVSDTKTGLMWKMCSEGQTSSDCSMGSAKYYNWQNALQQAKSVNNIGGFAGYKDWRVANKQEWGWILELGQCFEAIFPNIPPGVFWSSSSAADDSNKAWVVQFGLVKSAYAGKYNSGLVRLVRGGQ
ncbi:MAG: DUF1566 domain-containing protein [Methylococcaceae bacterium]